MPSRFLPSSRLRRAALTLAAVTALGAGFATAPWSALSGDGGEVAVVAGPAAPATPAGGAPIAQTTAVTAPAPTTTSAAPAASDPTVVAARRRPSRTTTTTGPTTTTLPLWTAPTTTSTTTTTGAPPRREPPDLRGRITYSSDVDRLPGGGEEDLWIMDPDGRNQRRFITYPGVDLYPDLSADGHQVVWANCSRAHVPNCWSIVVADSDGTNPHTIIAAPGAGQVPRFSPDGRRILFRSAADGSGSPTAPTTFFTVNLDGTDLRAVPGVADLHPWTADWAPDGDHIYVDSAVPDPSAVSRWEVALADGSRRLLAATGAPTRSPDGRHIAYGADHSLWVADIDRTNPRRLSEPEQRCGDLGWSPAGELLVFRCVNPGPRGDHDIWVATADGATVTNITATPANNERSPSF